MAGSFRGVNQPYGEFRIIDQLNLVDLPTDVLISIFRLCDFQSLRNLSLTCRRLHKVASEDCVWREHSKDCIATNQISGDIITRSFIKLREKDKCRISLNWNYGCYKESACKTSIKYMPWMVLEPDILWASRGRAVVGFSRNKHGLNTKVNYTIHLTHVEDISRFVKIGDIIISGGKDRLICGWSVGLKKLVFCQPSKHDSDIQGLDFNRNIIVSGSKDSSLKVWRFEEEPGPLICARTVDVSDRVWCVTLNPSLTCVASGSAGYYGIHPLRIFDLERGNEKTIKKSMVKNGAAIFDIQWECSNTLVTCGHDMITRLWDIRMGECVSHWIDPFGSPSYCLSTDKRHTIICGTAHHGRVQLWDKRAVSGVQSYFGQSSASSPVYSVSFDPCHLFIAQDLRINVLDFSVYGARSCDYQSLLHSRCLS